MVPMGKSIQYFIDMVSLKINYCWMKIPLPLHSKHKQIHPWWMPPCCVTVASAVCCFVFPGRPSNVHTVTELNVKPWIGCWVLATCNNVKGPFTRINWTDGFSPNAAELGAWQGARDADMSTGIHCSHDVTQLEGPRTQSNYIGYLELT